MTRTIFTSAVLAGTLALAGTAGATPALDRSLDACVRAVAETSGARRVEVVRRVERFGHGNFEYWLNADAEPAAKSYCRTHRDAISRLETSSGWWQRTSAARPAAEG